MKTTARIISVVFQPLLMTTYLFAMVGYFLPTFLLPIRPSIWFLLLVFLMTFILPLLNFIWFRVSGTIQDFNLFDRRQRILPFVFISVLYVTVTAMFYYKFSAPNILKLLIIISTMVVTGTFVTFFFKISVHSLAAWGIIGILVPLNTSVEGNVMLPAIAGSIVLAGLIMSSRLKLDAHTLREVTVGALVGFGISFFGMLWLF